MSTLTKEVIGESKVRRSYEKKIAYLGALCGINSSKLDFKSKISAIARRVKDKELLKKHYEAVCAKLDWEHKNQKSVTAAEDSFFRSFSSMCKIKLYPQTWIGNFCVDFFTPALGAILSKVMKGYSFKGIVFEIDGPIHQQEQRMKKDTLREKYLTDLNLSVWRVSNDDVYQGLGLPNPKNLYEGFRKLCSRERARIWSKVHTLTLLCHEPKTLAEVIKNKAKNISLGRKA